ncbi:MAG: MTH865 family protein [Haloarculaceae archaeon]
MADRDDLREQLIDAFEGADYPVSSAMDLVPALPDGPSTTFESGDFSMTAMELNTKVSGGNFPYDDVESLVEDLLDELEANGFL